MRDARLLSYVTGQPWAILPDKMTQILGVLARHAAGRTLSQEEIRAQIGPSDRPVESASAVAVIPLRGVIAHRMGTLEESSGGMSAERFTALVRAARLDDSVSSIVLDVDSPGGTTAGLIEAADEVWAARAVKRVVAVANATMASAAYWIASQASEIVAIPSALDRSIGSIGVFMVHADLVAALEKEGIKITVIHAGKHKVDLLPYAPLSEEAQAKLKANVEAAYEAFVMAVARGRGVAASVVRDGLGEADALSGADAKAAGLVDRIATMETVLREEQTRPAQSPVRVMARDRARGFRGV